MSRLVAPHTAPPSDAHENPLVPNALLRSLGTTMDLLRALRQRNVPGEEAIRASALLTLRFGDAVCDLSGANAGRTLAPASSLRWLDAPTDDIAESLSLLLGCAHWLRSEQVVAHPPTNGAAATETPLVLLFVPLSALSRATWNAMLSTAARAALPVLLVTLPGGSGEPGALSARSQRYGVPGIPVDSADAVALCRVLGESSIRARQGDGPTLIETLCWPLSTKPDDPIRKHRLLLAAKGLTSTKPVVRRSQPQPSRSKRDPEKQTPID